MKRAQVDALLAAWDAPFNARRTRRVNTRSVGSTELSSGAAVREHLQHIVKRTPQVLVRISGGGKGMGRIRAHLDYISRHGQLALEDQDGERHLGKEDLAWLGYSWQAGGMPIAEESGRREALNIVLSMPAGTDAFALQAAARAFAAAEFGGHQYAMVLHTLDGDPSRTASAHPHVHLCVKVAGDDGRRLNPRKQDLQRWRDAFAQRLREHGIDAAASRRLERLQPKRGKKQSELHMLARGTFTSLGGVADLARRAIAKQQEQAMRQRYAQVADTLAASEHGEDRMLAQEVRSLVERTRGRDPVRHR